MGMGPLGLGSRLQRLKQMGPSLDEAFKIFMDYTHWRVDAQLVKAYLEKATTTIDWLEKLGVEFVEPAAYFPGGWFTWHIVKPALGEPGPMAAATMNVKLTERAKEFGVEIMLQTPVKKILKQGDKIVGVMAEDQSGEPIQAMAKSVIVCTGGFGNNVDMIKKFTGYQWGKDMTSIRIPGIDGDGIQMAWEVGAAPTDMTMEMIYMMPGEYHPVIGMAFQQPHLMVNLLGERFINEAIMPNTTFAGNAIATQKDRCSFLIFDGEIKTMMETVGLDEVNSVFRVFKTEGFDAMLKGLLDSGFKEIVVADSLDELAAKTGIDADNLKKTVEQYNGYCEKGYDAQFNKRHDLLRPIKTPKFYAGRLLPSAYGSLGGIKINYKTEVLNKEWKKIPGLYAAGTDANTIYGDSYVFILPGNTMGFAMNTGRIAGEHAAEYAKSL